MPKLQLNANERARVIADWKGENFIDVSGHNDELCITVDLYPNMQYLELRKKDGCCRLFVFKKKGDKKYFDFDWWDDAEVIFSLNEVKHAKT